MGKNPKKKSSRSRDKKSSSESLSSSNASSQSSKVETRESVRFHVRIPELFRLKDLKGALLHVWGTRPADRYFQPLNRSRLRNADRSVWLKPEGRV